MHTMFKLITRLLFQLAIQVAYLAYRAEGINALLLVMPSQLIVPTLRKHGASIGNDVIITSPLIVHNANPLAGQHYANLVIGDHCYLGRDVLLDLTDRILLDEYVTISMRCTLVTHRNAGVRPACLATLSAETGSVRLGPGSYLGAGATLLHGVTLGERVVVAVGAVVVSDVLPRQVVGGVPARLLKTLPTISMSAEVL